MKVSTQQKSNVAEELKRGEKEKQGNRVACRKLAHCAHQDDGNQRKEHWGDASFLPPRDSLAIPIPCAHASAPPPCPAHARCSRAISSRAQHLFYSGTHPNPLRANIHSIYLSVSPKFSPIPHSRRNRPNRSSPQLQSTKSIPNPSSPRKESYPSSAQE